MGTPSCRSSASPPLWLRHSASPESGTGPWATRPGLSRSPTGLLEFPSYPTSILRLVTLGGQGGASEGVICGDLCFRGKGYNPAQTPLGVPDCSRETPLITILKKSKQNPTGKHLLPVSPTPTPQPPPLTPADRGGSFLSAPCRAALGAWPASRSVSACRGGRAAPLRTEATVATAPRHAGREAGRRGTGTCLASRETETHQHTPKTAQAAEGQSETQGDQDGETPR